MKIVAQGGNTGICGAARPRDADRNVVSRLDRMRKIRGQPAGEYNHVGGRLHLAGGARGGCVRGPLFSTFTPMSEERSFCAMQPATSFSESKRSCASDQARRRPERPSRAKLADMTALRLIADDLTGALDTAAEFVGLVGPVPVYWSGAIPLDLPPSAALDSGTRELGEKEAVARTAQLAKGLVDAKIAYKKVDSLLRGHVVAELVACLRGGAFRYCVLAPARPCDARRRPMAQDRWWGMVGDSRYP